MIGITDQLGQLTIQALLDRGVPAAFTLLMLVSKLLRLLAPTFAVMLLSRALFGLALGGFWAIAASLASRLVGSAALLLPVLVPRLPSPAGAGLRALPQVLRSAPTRVLLAAVLLVFIGRQGAYTFVRPFLQSQQVSPALLTGMLFLSGVSGVLGNFLAGARAAKPSRSALVGLTSLLVLSIPAALT